jgi:hypothetical protein
MPKAARVGLYLDPAIIVRNPGYLEALRDGIGLQWVILTFQGELPPEVLAHSPYDSVPPSPARVQQLIAYHLDGTPCTDDLDVALRAVGPHVPTSDAQKDAEMRRAIDMCQTAGLDVWFMAGMYTAYESLMFCPGNRENHGWYEAFYTHLATGYGVQGIDITHARYPKTSLPRAILMCGCVHCTTTASELGYNMAQMRADIADALMRFKTLTPKQLSTLANKAMGPLDLLHFVGGRAGFLDWFRFRADLIARNMQSFRQAVHRAGGDNFIFGADTYPASLSLLAGHDQTRWGDFSDFASPLLSHVDAFPMKTFTAWVAGLRRWFPQLSEGEALRLAYRLGGYADLKLPDNIADFALGEPDCEYRNIPLREMVRTDMAKAKLYLPEELPAYPVLQGGGAPWQWPLEIVQQLMSDALELGYDGYIFQGTNVLLDYDLKK